jgi:hypothetical protein
VWSCFLLLNSGGQLVGVDDRVGAGDPVAVRHHGHRGNALVFALVGVLVAAIIVLAYLVLTK